MTSQPDLSQLLGDESPAIHFPDGLIGLEDWQNFTLVSHPEAGDLKLLQSLQDERMSLIVIDPRQVRDNYRITLSATDAEVLGYSSPPKSFDEQTGIYCIVSVQEEPFQVNVNLLGPIVINWQKQIGRQIILADSGYGARYKLSEAEAQTERG